MEMECQEACCMLSSSSGLVAFTGLPKHKSGFEYRIAHGYEIPCNWMLIGLELNE